MTLLVDTSMWSLALRRGAPAQAPEVRARADALGGSNVIVATGLMLQELLQGFNGPRAVASIVQRFSSLAWVQAQRDDHIAAAGIRDSCLRSGVQIGTIDALIAQLCISNGLTLLTTDRDFVHAAKHCRLKLWSTS